MDAAAGLRRVLGRESLYLAQLRRFCESYADGLVPLRAALQAPDHAQAERWVHSLRGVSASIGCTQLPELAQTLEDGLRAGAPASSLAALAQAVEGPLSQLLVALNAALPAEAPPAPVATTDSGAGPRLADLNRLLRDDDAAAASYLHDHEAALRVTLHERFDAVRAAVQAFDFDAALALTDPSRAAG